MKFNLKYKPNLKDLTKYIAAILVIANLVCLFFLYQFTLKYVYRAFYPDQNTLMSKTRTPEDINVTKFDAVIKKLDKKTKSDKPLNFHNIFE